MIYTHVANKGRSGRKARRTCYKHAKNCARAARHQKSGRWNQLQQSWELPYGDVLELELSEYLAEYGFPPSYILFKNVSADANKWLI